MQRPNYLPLVLMLLLALFSPSQSEAKRYITPNDNQVLIEINEPVESTLDPESVKLFVWNMYKGDKPNWKRDFKKLSRGKDILLLQEVYLDYQMMTTLYEDYDYNYKMATAWIDTKNRHTPSGIATASTVGPVNYFWQRSHYLEPIIKTHKMAMFAEYAFEGSDKTVLTGNIHAINFVSSRKLNHMLKEMEKAFKKHDGPIILGGDFNTWSKRKTRYLREMAARLGLTEVKFKNDTRMRTFGRVLDYVFVRGFDILNSKVYGHIEGSDHKAMEIELRLRR